MSSTTPLLLLHGALYTAEEFDPLRSCLEPDRVVLSMNFQGHGDQAIPPEPFSIALFASRVIDYLDQKGIARVDVFGYSMGGYVGLFLARYNPDRVGSIFTLATKLRWHRETSAKEVKMLDPDVISAKVPQFALSLQRRHGQEKWRDLLGRTAEMMTNLGESNELPLGEFSKIENRVRLGVGDRDAMVTIEETVEAYRELPNGELIVLPRTFHPLEKVPPALLAGEIRDFFSVKDKL